MASEPSELDDSGYGETSRYAAHLDRGWSLLDRAEYEAARQSARHAQELRPDAPDASVLLGAVALAEGDPQEGLRWYENAIELDPEYFEPYLAAAQVALFDLGDAQRALQHCEDALELEITSAFDAIDLGLLLAECNISLAQAEAARERLNAVAAHPLLEATLRGDLRPESPRSDDQEALFSELFVDEDGEPLDDEEREAQVSRLVHLCLRLGRLWLDVQRADEALPLLRALAERYVNNSDAWHLLSEAEYQHGDARAACHASLRVYRLDSQLPVPTWLPTPAQIHRKVVEILTECPDAALRELGQRRIALVVLVHEMPAMEVVLEGIDPRISALALASRGPSDTSVPVLTGIAVYRRSLMRLARTPELFDQELRFAVLEELAAFFQLDDERRLSLGLHPLGPDLYEEAEPAAPVIVEDPKPSRRRRRKRMHS